MFRSYFFEGCGAAAALLMVVACGSSPATSGAVASAAGNTSAGGAGQGGAAGVAGSTSGGGAGAAAGSGVSGAGTSGAGSAGKSGGGGGGAGSAGESGGGASGASGATVTCGVFSEMGTNLVDSTTSLTWYTANTLGNYTDVTAFCVKWGGRIPTVDELQSYFAQANATFPLSCASQIEFALPDFRMEPVWSTGQMSGAPDEYFVVSYDGTPPILAASVDSHYAICVR